MADIGIVFDAEVFRVTQFRLSNLSLQNATFKNKVTGELLFSVRDAHIGLKVQDLYAWQLSRDITVDSTEINGAEMWVKFDENGRSNYDDLTLVEEAAWPRQFQIRFCKFRTSRQHRSFWRRVAQYLWRRKECHLSFASRKRGNRRSAAI